MPQRKSPALLQSIVLTNIARNMDVYWCANYIKYYLDQGKFIYIIGPFQYIPVGFLQKLLDKIAELQLMKKHHLHVVLDSRLRQVDLSAWKPVGNSDAIVSLIAVRCQCLTQLNISQFSSVSSAVLLQLATSLTTLHSLNLSGTRCNDQILGEIGASCHELQELRLSSCRAITDRGIESLCGRYDAPCRTNLSTLDVSGTAVTSLGLQTALVSLRSLQRLIHSELCTALYALHSREFVETGSILSTNQRRLSAIYIDFGEDVDAVDTVMVACAACPRASEVFFIGQGNDVAVSVLAALAELHELELGNTFDRNVTFSGGVKPLLQAVGSSIHRLVLEGIEMVDVLEIARLCPAVTEFRCSMSVPYVALSYPRKIATEMPQFEKLERLILALDVTPNEFNADDFKMLLRHSTQLRQASFAKIDSLSDDVVIEVLETNPLVHLEVLELDQCNTITGTSIRRLTTAENNLRRVKLSSCQHVTRRDYDSIVKTAKQKCFDLHVEWS